MEFILYWCPGIGTYQLNKDLYKIFRETVRDILKKLFTPI